MREKNELAGGKTLDYNYSFNLFVVGDSGIGKSSLINRFVDNNYTESFISTIGADFKVKNVELGDKIFKLKVWDTAGQDRFIKRSKSEVISPSASCQGFILCYDVTEQSSFEDMKEWLTIIKSRYDKNFPILLVGTKSDLIHKRVVDASTAEEFAKTQGVGYIETSAKTSLNVESAFAQLTTNIAVARKIEISPKIISPKIKTTIETSKDNILNRLDTYIARIDSYKGDYSKGFWFFSDSRAANRKANYFLAKALKESLTNAPPGADLSQFFKHDVINEIRGQLIKDKQVNELPYYTNRGVNSKDLNDIISYSRLNCPSV